MLFGLLSAVAAAPAPQSAVCAPGLDPVGPLCFPACKPGFSPDGPVCWEVCPQAWTSDGVMCRLAR